MSKLKIIKITLLIIILAEEIKSATKNNDKFMIEYTNGKLLAKKINKIP